jgi:hypothetical protein
MPRSIIEKQLDRLIETFSDLGLARQQLQINVACRGSEAVKSDLAEILAIHDSLCEHKSACRVGMNLRILLNEVSQ